MLLQHRGTLKTVPPVNSSSECRAGGQKFTAYLPIHIVLLVQLHGSTQVPRQPEKRPRLGHVVLGLYIDLDVLDDYGNLCQQASVFEIIYSCSSCKHICTAMRSCSGAHRAHVFTPKYMGKHGVKLINAFFIY